MQAVLTPLYLQFCFCIQSTSAMSLFIVGVAYPLLVLRHLIPAFLAQFSSPLLRRFNLVGMDMRSHGETKGPVPTTFRRKDAGEDVFEFMVSSFYLMCCCDDEQTSFQKALRLPPCHLFGLSLGACVALQTAISHPDKVLSLFMLSPLPLIEVGYINHSYQMC